MIRKDIPHFAHKSDSQGNRICKYSTETEEHIAGKKLLLNYMLSLYPDAKGEMRYVYQVGKLQICISILIMSNN